MPLSFLLVTIALAQAREPSVSAVKWAEWLRTHTEIESTREWTRGTWEVEPPEVITEPGFLSPKRDRLLTLDGRILTYQPIRPRKGELFFSISPEPVGPKSEATVAILLAQGRRSEAYTLAATLRSEDAEREVARAIASYASGRFTVALRHLHSRQDRLALEAARALLAEQPSLTAVAREVGDPELYKRQPLDFLGGLPSLIIDLERRVRTSIPKLKTNLRDASVLELIAQLEEIRDGIRLSGGTPFHRYDPVVEALVAKGNAAVPALLETLESDERLTRDVAYRELSHDLQILPVTSPAREALDVIVGVRELPGVPDRDRNDRKIVARVYRRLFEATEGQSLAQRAIALLREEDAQYVWVEAAKNLAALVKPPKPPETDDESPGVPRLGDTLTARERDEAVDLLERRFAAVGRDRSRQAVAGLMAELAIGRALLKPESAGVLLKEATDASFGYLGGDESRTDLGGAVARAFRLRIRRGDPGAVAEYETWLKRIALRFTPNRLDLEWLAPLRDLDTNPALASVGRWVLESSESPYRRERYRTLAEWDRPGSSRLGSLPRLVRDAFLQELADRSPAGTATYEASGHLNSTTDTGAWSQSGALGKLDLKPGESQSIRRCDMMADRLGDRHTDELRFSLGWSLARRDAAIRKLVARLLIGGRERP